ncbi:MAG: hypothetical protein NVS3B16_10330 [Vulcanimicrobiaceae bacterium]
MKRWTIAIGGLICVLGPGVLYSFSLLSSALSAAFGWTPGDVTWGFALANLFLALGGLAGGIAVDRVQPRITAVIGIALWAGGYALCGTLAQTHAIQLFYLYYGVIGGFGCGVAYISALATIVRWFPDRRGFGGGLVIMGFGLGSFVYGAIVKPTSAYADISNATAAYATAQAHAAATHVPFAAGTFALGAANLAHLMSIFTYSGIAFAVIGIAAAIVLQNPPAVATYVEPQYTLRQTLGDARFYVLWAMLFVNIFGGVTIISNMVPLVHELTGMQAAAAAGAYGLLAVFNGVGRFAWGWLSDRIGRRIVFALLFGGQALAFFTLDATHEPVVVFIAIAALLLCYGGGFGVMPALNADSFGMKHFGANYGAQLSAWGLAAVFGTYFISTMKTLSGSFSGLMQPVSIILLVAMFFPLIVETRRSTVAADGEAAPLAA